MSAWGELVSAALLGTERREPDAQAPLPVERATAEERLLARAAATAVYRRAGARPLTGLRPPEPAPPESLPRCSEAAGARLATILGGEAPGLLDEWLALAAARGVRAPEELLPALLATGPRDHLAEVAGERGRWLARVGDAWSWAAGDADVWRTGAPDARHAWLERRRADDPAAARAALEETWSGEDPRGRAVLLAVLRAGLSADDEPFLERNLDDRRQDVRAMAAALLASLPGSALAQRSAERALPLLRVGGRIRRVLQARLPEALDDAAVRDVVLVKPPRGIGERAWWLRRLLAATPLALWERELGGAPAELVSLPVSDQLRDDVHAGWAEAAARQRDAAWAEALLPETWDPELARAVPRERAERLALDALDDPRMLAALERPFGLELSRALARRGSLTRDLALALDPRVLPDLRDDEQPAVVRLLAFRHDLHEELA